MVITCYEWIISELSNSTLLESFSFHIKVVDALY